MFKEFKFTKIDETQIEEIENRIIKIDKIMVSAKDEKTMMTCSDIIQILHGKLNRLKKGLDNEID